MKNVAYCVLAAWLLAALRIAFAAEAGTEPPPYTGILRLPGSDHPGHAFQRADGDRRKRTTWPPWPPCDVS